ncbi:MAG: 2-C-methyl-D-erythritol 4-phosphate cytidylyltransferase [Verrucomicrobia bacterium]|nr:2-C-methyl-D-erythritol 4-phosphate cytidylyltransferase [Verrucomicrobiota bacterium]
MNSAVIVAAGKGTRFGPDRDKLFLEIEGMPVVGHTWRLWDEHPDVAEVVIVVRSGMEPVFRDLAAQLNLRKPWRLTAGGTERQHSVWNGLEAIASEAGLVSIHDGARPCTDGDVIRRCFLEAEQHGAAVAAQPVTDTIKQSGDGLTVDRHLDRSKLWAVQTPQTFRVEVIRRALQAVREKGLEVTDDTAACEFIGQPVRLVRSVSLNPKVTVPGDLTLVEALLRASRRLNIET